MHHAYAARPQPRPGKEDAMETQVPTSIQDPADGGAAFDQERCECPDDCRIDHENA